MKWNKIITDNKLLPDLINMILGVAVIVLFILVMLEPSSYGLMSALMVVAGIMNLSNGYRKYKVNGQKAMGIFFGMVGFAIFIFGIYYLRLALA
ncbi:hypothetical protein [Anaerosporobacter sp.]|uniref:hypothetical protein n=1 Tax=Anaerosporobacter sp. TaxID=1872529 RepID=UPI00286EF368|nr:hypothetical protein [Anaerosporobacter sp.]